MEASGCQELISWLRIIKRGFWKWKKANENLDKTSPYDPFVNEIGLGATSKSKISVVGTKTHDSFPVLFVQSQLLQGATHLAAAYINNLVFCNMIVNSFVCLLQLIVTHLIVLPVTLNSCPIESCTIDSFASLNCNHIRHFFIIFPSLMFLWWNCNYRDNQQ